MKGDKTLYICVGGNFEGMFIASKIKEITENQRIASIKRTVTSAKC